MCGGEADGGRQVWMTKATPAADNLTIYAASAVWTTSVRMGTSIVPTYPRHPLVLAQQALALGDLAPNRLRLGVGTSHLPNLEGGYGLPMTAPMEHLPEYVLMLRSARWEGKGDHHGRFYK